MGRGKGGDPVTIIDRIPRLAADGRIRSVKAPPGWVGVRVRDQKDADEFVPQFLMVDATVRFLSCEPLLSPVKLERYLVQGWCPECNSTCFVGFPEGLGCGGCGCVRAKALLSWVIVGGESGPGARPCDVAWIRSLVKQCRDAGTTAFVKQLGASPFVELRDANDPGYRGRMESKPRDRKGGDIAEWPADLRVRQFPEVVR